MRVPEVDIEIDELEFRRAIERYMQATKKDTAVVLNHTATQAAFKAMSARFTEQATARDKYLGKRYEPRNRKNWLRENKIYFALAVKNDKATVGNRYVKARKIWSRHQSSKGFIRANWGAVVNAMGVKTTGKYPRGRSDIKIKRATTGSPLASIYNAELEGKGAAKAQAKLERGWKRAIHMAVWGKNGMVDYANRRIRDNWRRAGRTAGRNLSRGLR